MGRSLLAEMGSIWILGSFSTLVRGDVSYVPTNARPANRQPNASKPTETPTNTKARTQLEAAAIKASAKRTTPAEPVPPDVTTATSTGSAFPVRPATS